MKSYRSILFDLDHTLWDYETNSTETLHELYHDHKLVEVGIPSIDDFLKTFVSVNTHLWTLYDTGQIHRDVIRYERFHKIMLEMGIDNYELSLKLSNEYVDKSPKKGTLMPNAIEILDYLHPRYPMTIVTNGFDEIQSTKLASSGITSYFKSVVTSARAGHKKPAKEIFEFALAESGYKAHETLMIGDNLLTDIGGARNASLDTVFYNPYKVSHQEQTHYEIHDLKELKDIL
ncbi:MAG TPA: YjjG family noncanonical pyrimidine nucleotidase [Cyclobacteriaceae bacterium]|nr:YjjG family noncanonical pyrimidine nucleotidase [Cyclobacteriaceae bacterium]